MNMGENTFILFKPDAMMNTEIQDYVIQRLGELELNIDFKKEIEIDKNGIRIFWEFTNRDILSKYALEHHFDGQKLLVLLISGSQAIKKVHMLKKETRVKYAKDFYNNCFHAPMNDEEYKYDVAYILNKEVGKKQKKALIHNIDYFVRFSSLEEHVIKEKAEKLVSDIKSNGIEKIIQESMSKKDKYNVCLCNDEEHELFYAAGAIYEYIPNIDICDAYMLAIGTDIYDEVILFSSREKHEAERIYWAIKESGLKTKLKCYN